MYPDIFENGGFFLLFNLPFTCKRRFGHRKRYFSRTVTRVKVFENAGFLYLCLSVMLSYFHHFSVFMWTDENDLNTLRVEAYLFSERRNRKAWRRALWLVYPSASSSGSDNFSLNRKRRSYEQSREKTGTFWFFWSTPKPSPQKTPVYMCVFFTSK